MLPLPFGEQSLLLGCTIPPCAAEFFIVAQKININVKNPIVKRFTLTVFIY